MQAADSLVAAATGIPAGLAIALAAGALCGTIGALASDLAADGGKLERWKGDATGWTSDLSAKYWWVQLRHSSS